MRKIQKIRLVNVGLIMFLSFTYFISSVLAVESLIASDMVDDIYRFKKDSFEEIADKVLDSESMTIEKADKMYEELDSKKDSTSVKKVDTHNNIDIKSVSFDEDNKTLYIKMSSNDFELSSKELIAGIFYTAEHIYYLIISKEDLVYGEFGKTEHTLKTLEHSLSMSKGISEDIVDEEFLKAIIVYYEDSDSNYVYVELFDSTAGTDYLILFIYVIIAILIMAVIIVIYLYYKNYT